MPSRKGRFAAALVLLIAAPAVVVFAQGNDARPLPASTDGHRVLRDNAPGVAPATEPAAFQGYESAPDFTVVTREDTLRYYPCAMCHANLPVNPEPRKLMAPHPAALNHGSGRFWCLDCHTADNRNALQTLAGEPVSFNDSHLVCGQCHYQPQRDWYFGAHGKRVGNWKGERTIYSCTHCHDPHDPSVKPRAPEAPPPVRQGLAPMPDHHHEATLITPGVPRDAKEDAHGEE